MINVMIDEFTPCLKDARTGELAQTEVIQIKRKSFLKKYKDSLSTMQGPILLSQCPDIKLDLRGLMKYAKKKVLK